jgi:hypothetical protein
MKYHVYVAIQLVFFSMLKIFRLLRERLGDPAALSFVSPIDDD